VRSSNNECSSSGAARAVEALETVAAAAAAAATLADVGDSCLCHVINQNKVELSANSLFLSKESFRVVG
jgi:hypothetical protein